MERPSERKIPRKETPEIWTPVAEVPSTPEREVSGESNITFEAGNISRHIENWQKLTNDKFILNMVLGSEIPIKDLDVYTQK